jgi:hypothetical protein
MASPDPLEGFKAEQVLSRLHGFQRDAVENAFERLFLSENGSRRFLVADEVGLGKTLIARGILAKALEHLLGRVDRIDVVYICSNLAIAAQNIDRLNPVPGLEFSDAERITMLPIHLKELDSRKVNFVAFTPGTSLNLGDNLGTSKERLLLHALLKRHWGLRGAAPLNLLQGYVQNWERFREQAEWYEETDRISEPLAAAFFARLDQRPELRTEFEALCASFPRPNSRLLDDARARQRAIVGNLRNLLAETCIKALEPDLVILDEFQRFKDLLTTDTDQGELAHHLFRWSNGADKAHVLLLSATPYKAYTLQHETAADDHYADFERTVAFLQGEGGATDEFRGLLKSYRHEMYRLRESDGAALRELKAKIEGHLRKVMSRTERLSAGPVVQKMVRTVATQPVKVSAADLKAYGALRRLSDSLEAGEVIEYWKSAAYPLNFMEGYQLKKILDERSDEKQSDAEFAKAIQAASEVGLPFKSMEQYAELAGVSNARTRALMEELVQAEAVGPLWLPPALPYYLLTGPFAKCRNLTKQLIFSAWHVAPRSLAALLSYECERRAFTGDEGTPQNTADARKARSGPLRFAVADDKSAGMQVLTLVYPSLALAKACDPREFLRTSPNATPSSEAILEWAKSRVAKLLPPGLEFSKPGERAEEIWYWMAPIVVDSKHGLEMHSWWTENDLAERWAGSGDEEDDDAEGQGADEGWQVHVREARDAFRDGEFPGGKAPHDLLEVLALAGLAGPANCALRSLISLFGLERQDVVETLDAAGSIGMAFRALYNRQESVALVRRGRRDRPYWRLALEHGHEGCLSAVLDEYFHVLRDARGLSAMEGRDAIPKLAEAVVEALQIRTASLAADEPYIDEQTNRVARRRHSMRTLFAMRFGSDKTEDAERVQRDKAVSSAFNSPFWPFVLATTSVGQEGLDFHWYCHSIVHWNLPSNPVDLEQREGRIHRYKGHAVRKNVAKVHGAAVLASAVGDVWSKVFAKACADAPKDDRGLVPYWLYPIEGGATIERRVPLYPMSRDEIRFHALQKSLGAYRMVFGQPRQEELLAFLVDHLDKEKLEEWSKVLMMDIAPPRYVPKST